MTLEIKPVKSVDSPEIIDVIEDEIEKKEVEQTVEIGSSNQNNSVKEEEFVVLDELHDDTTAEVKNDADTKKSADNSVSAVISPTSSEDIFSTVTVDDISSDLADIKSGNIPLFNNVSSASVEESEAVAEETAAQKTSEKKETAPKEIKKADFLSSFTNKKIQDYVKEFGEDKVFEIFDKDKDGKITEEEIKNANSSCSSLDDFTLGEIKKILKTNSDSKTEDKDTDEVVKKAKKSTNKNKNDKNGNLSKANSSNASNKRSSGSSNRKSSGTSSGGSSGVSSGGSSGVSSVGSSGGVSGSSGSSGTNSSSGTKNTEADSDSIEGLEKQKTEKESDLKDLNSSLSKVQSGEDEEISDKKNDMDDKEKEYKSLLEEEGKNNPEINTIKTNIEEKEKEISDKQTEIDKTQLELVETEQSITNKENEINGYKLNKTALESALTEAKSVTQNDSNKSDIQNKITSIQSQIDEEQAKIDAAEKELTDLKTKKTEQEKSIETLTEEKKGFETERDTFEKDLESKVSEKTKTALKSYQDARTTYESTKDTRFNAVKEEIEGVQGEITTIEAKINTLKAAELEKANSVKGSGQYNEERGKALADAALSLYGSNPTSGGMCGSGVSNSIAKAFGYTVCGNGCDYGDILSDRDDWVEVTDEYEVNDLTNLPAGAVVSWSTYEPGHTPSNGQYGHVWISDGNGHEVSDYTGDVSLAFHDWGASYRIFLPT